MCQRTGSLGNRVLSVEADDDTLLLAAHEDAVEFHRERKVLQKEQSSLQQNRFESNRALVYSQGAAFYPLR
jgi:hypothetical protein